MPELISQPFFLFGLLVFVAGLGAVAVKAFGVEVGAVTPSRSWAVAAVGLLVMAGGAWAADSERFEITALDIEWENQITLRCDSVQAFSGAIQTSGKPREVVYRILANGNAVMEGEVTPSGEGRTPIGGQLRVYGEGLPSRTSGLTLSLEIVAPVSLSSAPSKLGSLPQCGFLSAQPTDE